MRDDLPPGTVTFLFTDVEGSTKLLHELGAEEYAAALREHRRVIRQACAAESGVEVDTQGDAFFFAFPTAPGALAAAATFTDALAPGPIQVRVGLHTGTPLLTEEGYVGDDVHRAARIAAAAHGGQVVASSSTASLVENGLLDLGEHRLKDLSAPERIYQLGEGEFPALKSLYRTNLPVSATPFVGRERELAEVVELLAREDARLLTLTGPGGTGKTRLALQAAAMASDAYPDGVWWVPLASLRDPALVLPTAAKTLGSTSGLAEHIQDKAVLCLFDNFEHVVEAAPEIGALVGACPNLDVLVTSRERLRIGGEQTYPVPPLAEVDGEALFVTHARAVDPAFAGSEVVRELCRQLDGLPLALELAAARTALFSPEQLLERLSQRLDLLKGGRDADPRQQTLRATIEWSYGLLSDEEQRLFSRLAVFAGGCTYGAAEEIAGADPDTLQSLLDKSLLRKRDAETGPRFWMLETIRDYADEKLAESGSLDKLRKRHAEYFLELGQSLGLTMESLERHRVQRFDVAIAEQHNFRAAIEWAAPTDPELAVRIACSLENFWVTHDPHEGTRRFDAFLERASELPPELRAAAHRCRGNTRLWSGDRVGGAEDYDAALAGFEEIGDEVGSLLVEHHALVNREVDDVDERRRALETLRERFLSLGFQGGEVLALAALSGIERHLGNTDREAELLEETADRAGAIGFTWWELQVRGRLARLDLERGRLDSAHAQGVRALGLAQLAGDLLGVVYGLTLFAKLAVASSDNETAGVLWGAIESEADRRPLGMWSAEARAEAEASLPLDDVDFDRGRRRGRRLSLDEAVEVARGEG